MISFNKRHSMLLFEHYFITAGSRTYIALFLKAFCNIGCFLLFDVYSRIYIVEKNWSHWGS